MTREQAAASAASSRARQGLPPTIADPHAVTAVASMVADAILQVEQEVAPSAA